MILIKLQQVFCLFKQTCDLSHTKALVDLTITFDSHNEGDRFSLYLNENLLEQIFIPVNENKTLKLKYFTSVYSNECNLFLKNTSDDDIFIKEFIGGITMSDPLTILNVLNKNPKSFDIELNSNFEPHDIVDVDCLTDLSKNIGFTVCINSQNPVDTIRTIVLNSGSELISGYRYKVTVTRGTETASYEFDYVNFPAIIDCDIETFGDRIITISFPYPVNNLRELDGANNLQNFYAMYFDKDTNSSTVANPDWIGAFTVSNTLSATVSEDLRTLQIQSFTKGLPLGNHSMIVNYSKYQSSLVDPSVVLTDYNTPPRIVPVISKEFAIKKVTLAAKLNDIIVISRTELIVCYDEAVLLRPLANMNVLSTNGVNLNATSVTRVPGTYNKLLYRLSSSTPLPIGSNIPITVGSIIDANGYDTEIATLYRNVTSVKPKFLSVTQVENTSTPETELELTFSQEMDMTGGPNSATNPLNYEVFRTLGTNKNIISITSLSAYKVLMVTEKLEKGLIYVTARNIVNLLNESIAEDTLSTMIDDYTAPAVTEIIATQPSGASMTAATNSFIIKFDDEMSVTGKYSAISYLNYRLDYSGASPQKIELPSATILTPLKNNNWVRFELPVTPTAYPAFSTTLYDILIGYAKVKDIRLVQNAAGNYYPLCSTKKITRLVAQLSIVDGDIEVVSDSKLHFVYTGGNSFYQNTDKADFAVTLNGSAITPLSVSVIDDATLEFIFPQGTFTSSSYNITIATRAQASITTKDIFNKPIVGGVTNNGPAKNKVKSILKGISIANIGRVSSGRTTVALALKFNQVIRSTAKEDFRVLLNGAPAALAGCEIITAAVKTGHTDTVELICAIPATTDFANASFSVSVARSENLLQTIDYNFNTIPIFINTNSQTLKVNAVKWTAKKNTTPTPYTVENTFEIAFQKPIDFTKLSATFATQNTVTIKCEYVSTASATTFTLYETALASPNFGQFVVGTSTQMISGAAAPITGVVATKVNDFTLKIVIPETAMDLAGVILGVYVPQDYVILDVPNALYINSSYQPRADYNVI